jgi:pimeloyl-ACP methyl ester carboxylesterase
VIVRRSWVLLAGMLSISIGAPAAELQAGATGLQHDVVFTDYSPLSGADEVARRNLSPLANAELARAIAEKHTVLRGQAIDLSVEAFDVYVPKVAPSQGYALLVFIPPWQKAHLPVDWASVLDKYGMIFVSASNSGNSEKILDRRIPLALLGAYNIMQRYPVDKDRVYISGMSGGSRVAMRVALAYPDVFRGAMLNAGSDPLGTEQAVVPPADLLRQFQDSSRLVYVTGALDTWNIEHDAVSRQSMHELCIFETSTETMDKASHEVAPPAALDHALRTLDSRRAPDPEKLSSCRARIARELSAKLQKVQELLGRGKPHDAWQALTKIDVGYGGLAAPASIELAMRIGDRR